LFLLGKSFLGYLRQYSWIGLWSGWIAIYLTGRYYSKSLLSAEMTKLCYTIRFHSGPAAVYGVTSKSGKRQLIPAPDKDKLSQLR
jgi:hypothetical protein